MIEPFEETVIKKRVRVTCDFCPYTKVDDYGSFGTCAICGKLGCYKCGEFFYDGGSDHHSHYGCKEHAPLIRDAFNERDNFEATIPDIEDFINRKKEGL
jgi:hypothetical protein